MYTAVHHGLRRQVETLGFVTVLHGGKRFGTVSGPFFEKYAVGRFVK